MAGQDFRDLGDDHVLVLSRIEERGAGSGGQVAAMAQIRDFRDGEISRVGTFLDDREALAPVGLPG